MRVFAERVSLCHSATLTRLTATAVMTCCKRVFANPMYAASAQAATTNRLRMCAFDAGGASGIALPKLLRCLISSSGLQRVKILAGLQRDDTRLDLRPGAATPHWASGAVISRAKRASNCMPLFWDRCSAAMRYSVCPLGRSRLADPSRRGKSALLNPSAACACQLVSFFNDWADNDNSMTLLAVDQHAAPGVAHVDQMFRG